MRIISYGEVEAKEVEGSSKLKIRWLNTEGSRNFAVRHIEIAPDGYSPYHSHPWEHEIFVLEGNGVAFGEKGVESISVGDLVSIPGEEIHQIKNTGKTTLKVLCMIPK
ncbi:MAG: cupin domain-containing protein [Candidatus Bathyarchaeota archaeon]|nr:cupin domain-containing protein [Candidatus Bathyarchaeota archaeon]